MRVLIGCERSGIIRDAFIAKGHEAVSCDIENSARPGPHITGDVRQALCLGWDLFICHPPCRYLTFTGNRWFAPAHLEQHPERIQMREDALRFFVEMDTAPVLRRAIENPHGIQNTCWRPPDQVLQPCDYGDPVRKATGLWLTNLPPLFPTSIVYPEITKHPRGRTFSAWYNRRPPAGFEGGREAWRAQTFPGIAAAMAEQWG